MRGLSFVTQPRLRRPIFGVLSSCALALVVTASVTDATDRRSAALSAVATLYAVYDPWSEPPAVVFGPPPDTHPTITPQLTAGPQLTAERLQRRIEQAWPGHVVTVELDQPAPDVADRLAFHHKLTTHSAAARFCQETQHLLVGQPDLFELCRRIRPLTEHGISELAADEPFGLLTAARGGQPLLCYQFAALYCQTCLAAGYTARVLGLSNDGTSFAHAVVEVYAPEYQGWILIDIDFNVAYRRNGQWLTAADLQRAWQQVRPLARAGRLDPDRVRLATGVEMVVLSDAGAAIRRSNLTGKGGSGMLLELYNAVFYAARNDTLSGYYPPGHPDRVRQYLLTDLPTPLPICPEALRVVDSGDLYTPLGRTTVALADRAPANLLEAGLAKADDSQSGTTLTLRLQTFLPNFTHFAVARDGGNAQTCRDGVVRWPLTVGTQTLRVEAVNAAGRAYEPTRLSVEILDPAAAASSH